MIREEKIEKLESAFNILHKDFNQTYCQTYKWVTYMYKYSQSNFVKRNRYGKFKCYVLEKNNVIKCVMPLVFWDNKISILGFMNACDYIDFVYGKDITLQDIDEIFTFLKEKYQGYTFFCKNLSKQSILNEYPLFKDLVNDIAMASFSIPKLDEQTYDNWFNSLSKSVRQNIRTAYNRLKSDDLEISFNQTFGKNSKDDANKFCTLHNERLKKRYAIDEPFLVSKAKDVARRLILGKFAKDTVIYNSMIDDNNQVVYSLYIGNELACVYFGLIVDAKVSFLRVFIEDNFKKYSPGMVLFNEIMKSNNRFTTFDFTLGDEPYKIKLGCELEYIKQFSVVL